ncbi:hypothetical protein LTR10_012617 [Elasticomyces elasticus]|uniref:Transcription factor domain-containing protein n=1 Tax=Exophiala sideris TaxID=1016849 RepID=A0ABR0JRG4_9EURO|nr:hypothetical protein LTR10_012617 [Elasticomyces elasticus]KAK5040182.1 hypothetical protein LTS07_000679 [Exophiala sideris]KAK5068560.1 hypothetical protein LTR69_000680 [Exophiala sideris]KAK5186158.1 hypothetical protein LTR44_001213 [Eurotiomycetes sp. CCFEE 6388]
MHPKQHSDVISAGLVSLSTAHSLLSLFHVHYGRWVKFTDDISTEALLLQVRRSPLLLCSIFLIAVRHTAQELANRVAPTLFEEAKRLVASSLLVVPQTFEFFQAALVLSLWSTTIGQVPLSVDSWLLTGYALQQCLASPLFNEVLQTDSRLAINHKHHNALCMWNHLCVAHLQYCVGTRRQALLTRSQVEQCLRILDTNNVTNFEARMVAEAKLYWIVYEKCSGSQVNVADTKAALKAWQEDWAALFDEPRAQFLQMGFNFAHLLAYCQSLKSARAVMRSSVLAEMIERSRLIINLAMDTTDERTRHLTDHIYHTITFSALTLCRLVHTYESKLRAANHDIYALDALVFRLVSWLRSIGLPCHAAHILGDVVSAQFKKLRPNFQQEPIYATGSTPKRSHEGTVMDHPTLPLPDDVAFQFPDFIGSELFNLNDDTSWPQWDMLMSDTDMSV